MSMSRRTLLSSASIAAAGTLTSPAILHWPANAAEFGYKYGTALPDGHPMVIRSKEAATKIKEESGGKFDITLYPSSVLGQDTAMMSQAIAGARRLGPLQHDAQPRRCDRHCRDRDLLYETRAVSLGDHYP
jgi:TRAP-type transport system periplasmic protein